MPADFVTPEWVKDAIFYQIFPDRFAISQDLVKPNNLEEWDSIPTIYGFKGGDLLGVLERLDYLQDLGITGIYLNPIFQSASNHRYHTHDYYRVDPILGGNSAFRLLLKEAHRRGIRIVLDGVFNHASRGFFHFNHILETGPSSPYLDWFIINDFPLNAYQGHPNYKSWVGLPALPEFNTNNPQVRQFIFDVACYWIDLGIDGWRLDVPFCIDDDEFWEQFRQVVKGANPDAYIVGEVPWEAHRWLNSGLFDAVMNYQFTQACLGFFAGERINREVEKDMMGLPPTIQFDASSFAQRMEDLLNIYPRPAVLAQMNLLDSHDMPRFVTLAGGDQSALRLAVLFQMTYPGAPCIYYGDEIGMSGGKSSYPEASRHAFIWDQSQWDHDLLSYYQRCITLRKAHPALRTGAFTSLYAEDPIYAFLRELDGETLIIVLNNGTQPYAIDFPTHGHLDDAKIYHNQIGDGQVSLAGDRLCGLTLAPRTGCVLASTG